MTEEMARPVVLLDRVVDGVTPDYCLHGRVECVRCHQWCHLGHRTERVVTAGEALPLCLDCVHDMRASGDWPEDARPADRLEDNRRADGPHETEIPADWVQVPCGNPTCSQLVWAPPNGAPGAVLVRTCSTSCTQQVTEARQTLHGQR